jgi:hypothetical protein
MSGWGGGGGGGGGRCRGCSSGFFENKSLMSSGSLFPLGHRLSGGGRGIQCRFSHDDLR